MKTHNESWLQMGARHTAGRAENLVRIPLNLLAQVAMITKIAIKALIIAPIQGLVNLGLWFYAAKKGKLEIYESKTFFGTDKDGFSRDFHRLGAFFFDNGNFFKNAIAAPSIESYRNQTFKAFFDNRIDAIFTNKDHISGSGLRRMGERETGSKSFNQ